MVRSRIGLKALGLCSVVLGLMAFVASAAQAEAGANWKVNGVNVTTLAPGLKAAVESETASLLTTILKIPTKVLCKTLTITNTLGASGSVNEGDVTFASCATYLNGSATASAPCLPKTAGVNDIIKSNKGKGLLILVGGVGETEIKANTEPLATIESTEECAVGQKIKIEGKLVLKDCQGKIKEELATHLVEVDNTASTLKASGQAATIDGSANVTLSGVHEGLKWSGQPA